MSSEALGFRPRFLGGSAASAARPLGSSGADAGFACVLADRLRDMEYVTSSVLRDRADRATDEHAR